RAPAPRPGLRVLPRPGPDPLGPPGNPAGPPPHGPHRLRPRPGRGGHAHLRPAVRGARARRSRRRRLAVVGRTHGTRGTDAGGIRMAEPPAAHTALGEGVIRERPADGSPGPADRRP